MENKASDLVIFNGLPIKTREYHPDSSGMQIYEVIRLINGRFLFLNDHFERLRNSCSASGICCPDKKLLNEHLKMLLSNSPVKNGNIRLVVSKGFNKTDIATFFVPHFYPSEDDYMYGVSTKTYSFERPDPNIKKWNEKFRKNVGLFIQNEGIYEAILINDKGRLTEGSRSNLFFIDQESVIVTAPQHLVLAGITRKYIFEICMEQNIKTIEKALSKAEATKMKSCFLSGTSPAVLPVRQLDAITYDVQNPVLKTIMENFNRLVHNQYSR